MSEPIYRGLSAKELDFILAYADMTDCGELGWLSIAEVEVWEPTLDRLAEAVAQIKQEHGNVSDG